MTSCNERNNFIAETVLPIESIDELAGNWKGKAECTAGGRKLDSVTVGMKFDGELLTVNFNLYDSKSDGFPFPFGITIEYKNTSEYFKKGDTLTLQPSSIMAWNGTNIPGSELYPENIYEYPAVKLIKKNQKIFKVLYDLQKANKIVYQQSNKKIGYAKLESNNVFEISRIQNEKDFWYFNRFRSMSTFSNSELAFVSHDLDVADNYVLATKYNLSIYFDLPNDNGVSDKNDFLKDFSKYGSIFKLDVNADGQQDLAGYFMNFGKLYFMVFLNNGVTYNEFFKQHLTLQDELRPVLMKDTFNGKEVFRINYVNHYLTNYLYYDVIEKKMKVHLTD